MKSACEAYLNARKELSILLSLQHENIVPLIGITCHPLALILKLAPQGALNTRLMEYKRMGVRLSIKVIQLVIKQVSHIHIFQICVTFLNVTCIVLYINYQFKYIR